MNYKLKATEMQNMTHIEGILAANGGDVQLSWDSLSMFKEFNPDLFV